MRYDYLIVGAGSAGCVLAHRLSARGANVLLLEAGPDTPPGHVPADITDLYPRSYYNGEYAWRGLTCDPVKEGSPRPDFTQARVMGGGSSLMGMIALRGLPDDYDSWRSLGADGWGWSDVLPFFRKVESDRECGGPLHGSEGRVCVRRHLPVDWPPFTQAVAQALERRGYPYVEDFNGEFSDGHGPLPLSSTLSSRVTSASAYLDRETRARPNLTVQCDTLVESLKFQGNVCRGVTAVHDGARKLYEAAHTVLAAGAIASPAILLRSGIGPEQELKRLGTRVVVDRPGVGSNLQNHPVIYLGAHIKPEARQSPSLRPGFNSGLRYSSSGTSRGDLQVLVLNKSSWHGLGACVAGLGVCLLQPVSRGEVRLTSPEATVLPEVNFKMLTEDVDRQRLSDGLLLAAELMADNCVRSLRNETFVAGYSQVVRRLNKPGLSNIIVTNILAKLLDGPDFLRHHMLKWGIARGDVREDRLSDRNWASRTVSQRAFATYHPAGTCALGAADKAEAVVDPRTAVIGTENLRVVDASIMPFIPRANTNLPVMMLAERACALIEEDDRY